MKTIVCLDKAKKELKIVPHYILLKLNKWIIDVEQLGIREVRKKKGYHDEPLQGRRWGQRSIRLSKGYRAIYIELISDRLHIISVEEVTKHEY